MSLPTVAPWTMSEVDSTGNKLFNRTPYYYHIDMAGNQLPYIDRQNRNLFSHREAINRRRSRGSWTARNARNRTW